MTSGQIAPRSRWRPRVVPAVALVLACAIVALLVYGVTSKGADVTLDDAVKNGRTPTAPGATLRLANLDGEGTTTLASHRGKIVVLNFWASWCDPCRTEAPLLEQAQRTLTARGEGTVLGATFNDTRSDSRAFIREFGITYPNVRDIGTNLAKRYGTIGLPETFVIDARGRVVAVSRGQIRDQSFLTNAIAKARQTP